MIDDLWNKATKYARQRCGEDQAYEGYALQGEICNGCEACEELTQWLVAFVEQVAPDAERMAHMEGVLLRIEQLARQDD